jgi:hypothetical protein
MRALHCSALAALVAIVGLTQAQLSKKQVAEHHAAREKLIGAWHLAHIDSPGQEGKPTGLPQPQGMLIYTRDGHVGATHVPEVDKCSIQ